MVVDEISGAVGFMNKTTDVCDALGKLARDIRVYNQVTPADDASLRASVLNIQSTLGTCITMLTSVSDAVADQIHRIWELGE